jgi:hypothetical protein
MVVSLSENTLMGFYTLSGILVSIIVHLTLLLVIFLIQTDEDRFEYEIQKYIGYIGIKYIIYTMSILHFILITLPIYLEHGQNLIGVEEIVLRRRVFWLNILCISYFTWVLLILRLRFESALVFAVLNVFICGYSITYDIKSRKKKFWILKLILILVYFYLLGLNIGFM